MKKNTSKTQVKILNCIIGWIKEYGYPPTLRELSKSVGLKSTWTIRYHLNNLQKTGYIKLRKGVSRGIILVKDLLGIPILGNISAGKPIDAIENIDGYVNFSDMFVNNENTFALKVRGDSMTGAGIFEGDYVFVRKQEQVSNGEITVALLGDEAVVKKFSQNGKTIKLMSENPKYKPITSNDIKILGKVIGVLRKYNGIK